MKNIRGKNLIQFLLDLPEGYTLYLGSDQIGDLALIDNFKWYSMDINEETKEVHIAEGLLL